MYCRENKLIYTGGSDGSLIAWSHENGYIKYCLHDYDKSCTSEYHLRDQKAVDCVSLKVPLMNLLVNGS